MNFLNSREIVISHQPPFIPFSHVYLLHSLLLCTCPSPQSPIPQSISIPLLQTPLFFFLLPHFQPTPHHETILLSKLALRAKCLRGRYMYISRYTGNTFLGIQPFLVSRTHAWFGHLQYFLSDHHNRSLKIRNLAEFQPIGLGRALLLYR